MITDIDEDQINKKEDAEVDSIWSRKKTRLLLARALYRAYQRNCSILILDESDKGLPAETTLNIIQWHQSRGILFLTLHTEQAHRLQFDQI